MTSVRQGLRSLRSELPGILATRTEVLLPPMLRIIEDLAGDWRRLDEHIAGLSSEIEAAKKRLHHNVLATASARLTKPLATRGRTIHWVILVDSGISAACPVWG
jgi:hypothetical protein